MGTRVDSWESPIGGGVWQESGSGKYMLTSFEDLNLNSNDLTKLFIAGSIGAAICGIAWAGVWIRKKLTSNNKIELEAQKNN